VVSFVGVGVVGGWVDESELDEGRSLLDDVRSLLLDEGRSLLLLDEGTSLLLLDEGSSLLLDLGISLVLDEKKSRLLDSEDSSSSGMAAAFRSFLFTTGALETGDCHFFCKALDSRSWRTRSF
jgi:hypothetical protein